MGPQKDLHFIPLYLRCQVMLFIVGVVNKVINLELPLPAERSREGRGFQRWVRTRKARQEDLYKTPYL